MYEISRRNLLLAGSAAAFGGIVSSGGALAQSERLRMCWWGNSDRSERTFAVVDLFLAANPGIEMDGQSLPGGGDYWTWLATQTSGGSPPDLIQMDYRYIFEYAARGVLLPLDELIGSAIDLSGWPQDRVDVGRVDGKVYGISLGANTGALIYNRTAFEEAGVEPPVIGGTWEQFADACARLRQNTTRPDFYGTQDASGTDLCFETFLRQRGKAMYSSEGEIGFAVDDAQTWFALWADMRKSGACVPADIQALSQGGVDTSAVTTGRAASSAVVSNQLVSYQKASADTLGMTSIPTIEGGLPGQYLKPSQYFSVSARTENPELAGRFLDFFLNNAEAQVILGVERGVPEAAATRKAIMESLDAASQAGVAYIDDIADLIGPLPPPPPTGAGDAWAVLQSIAEEIAFEAKTVEQGAADLVTGMADALARA